MQSPGVSHDNIRN